MLNWRRLARVCFRYLLPAVIVIVVGYKFYDILSKPELRNASFAFRLEWLFPAGLLYLMTHTIWAIFWVLLLRHQGFHASYPTGWRAYFVSQYGKYIPGKVWVILIRIVMLGASRKDKTIVGVTATYETLTSMAAGAIIGVILLPLLNLDLRSIERFGALNYLLIVVALIPLSLGLMHRVVVRIARRKMGADAEKIPNLNLLLLIRGLVQASAGYFLLGLSLWMTVQAIRPAPIAFTWDDLLRMTAIASIAYVIGFVAFFLPGGVGAREVVVVLLLQGEFEPAMKKGIAAGLAVAVATGLRAVWTVAEIIMMGLLYRYIPAIKRPATEGPRRMSELAVDPNAEPTPRLISIVVPVFNEKESLAILHREIDESAKAHGLDVEIIFVDDGSADGSWEVIRGLTANDPRVRAIRFRTNFGKAAALSAGFKMVRGPICMTMDADLQDDPHEIPRFIKSIDAGLDVVSGWKKQRNDPFYKVIPSRIFNRLVGRLTGVRLHDHNCGMKCYRREVLQEVRLYGELHRFIPVLASARGFKVGELVVNHRRRKFGKSKYGFRRYFARLPRFADRQIHHQFQPAAAAFLGQRRHGELLRWHVGHVLPGGNVGHPLFRSDRLRTIAQPAADDLLARRRVARGTTFLDGDTRRTPDGVSKPERGRL